MKKIIKAGILGMPLGITIGLIIALIFSYLNHTDYLMASSPQFFTNFSSNLDGTTFSILLWALMGFVFSSSSLVFNIENWSITKQTVIHFITTFILFTILACLAGWFPLQATFFIYYFIEFLIIYLIVWTTTMAIEKKKINELNRLLNKRNKNY